MFVLHAFHVFRSLLQQLQKLQTLISGKVVPHSCKIASTQTGTCLMVSVCWLVGRFYCKLMKTNHVLDIDKCLFWQMMALCFVLVLGSFSSCLSPLSFPTDTSPLTPSSRPSSPKPLPSADLHTTQGRSTTIYSLSILTSSMMWILIRINTKNKYDTLDYFLSYLITDLFWRVRGTLTPTVHN